MGLDFDAVEYCKNIKQRTPQPPYKCPVEKCDRSYKTVLGLQYHLVNYDHDNPQPLTPLITPSRKKARSRGAHHATPKTPKGGDADNNNKANAKNQQCINPESLVTYHEEDSTVQFNIDGKSVRIGIDETLPFVDDQEYNESVQRGLILNPDAPPLEENASWSRCEVPQANFRELTDYHVPDAPARSLAYYRFIEKSAEELDGEIEYDVDEEDTAWLEWMNEQREQSGCNSVTIDTMELLMDRLEKESYFQAAANGTSTAAEVDDDAVCCICMDGECQNTNVILFCDMCNLAVHQDCYGVPYIPEGQWLCRRCLQSPSTPVSCVLCPNAGGAFKQTDRGQWAHVVCALWIPEVRFANTVFLEPIDSIETIPAARWRLTCYVCKEKGLGACIQCHRNSCYAAFHVTCAQQAGLYMTMDTINDGHDTSIHVQKFAYCHAHTPPDAKLRTNQKEVEDTRHKMKEARKALAKKRSSAPVVLIPTIPPDRVQEISAMVHMQKKSQFLERLIAYWTLKRQFRNGVPLLRRLQSQGNHHAVIHRNGIEGAPDTKELYKQLKYWQCLRQDLERARLLCELVRKREKLKASYVKICEQVTKLKLNPLESALSKLLDALEAKDTSDIFKEPVDTNEVPDYCEIVKQPMDLGTMREKLKGCEYSTLEQLEQDFDLMIQNCLAYNNKDTVFYRAGIRMRDQAAPLFVQQRKELQRQGLLQHTQMSRKDHVEEEVEDELKELLALTASEEVVQKLLILADKSQVLKDPSYRTKKIKQIRMEITRMRKHLQKERLSARHPNLRAQSLTDDDDMDSAEDVRKESPAHERQNVSVSSSSPKKPMKARHKDSSSSLKYNKLEEVSESTLDLSEHTQTPPCSPIKSLHNSSSPVGVNRRTAVLFTRKAQAALKRPIESTFLSTPVKEEVLATTSSGTTASTNPVNNLSSSVLSNSSNTSNHNVISSTTTNSLLQAGNLTTSLMNNKLSLNSNTNLHKSTFGVLGVQQTRELKSKSPKRANAKHKRLNEMRHSASLSPKKSTNCASTTTPTTLTNPPATDYSRIPDSFRVYRANNERDVSESEDEEMSDISGSRCSSCSGFSGSGSGSDYDSSDDDEDHDDDDDENEAQHGSENETHAHRPTSKRNDSTMLAAGLDMRHVKGNGNMLSCSDSAQSSSSDDDEVLALKAKQPRLNGGSFNLKQRSVTPSLKTNLWKRGRKTRSPSTNSSNTMLEQPEKLKSSNRKAARSRSNGREKSPLRRSRGRSVNSYKSNRIDSEHDNHLSQDSQSQEHTSTMLKPPLEPLQLVWAKCRGYPWYPALILDPKTPKGFVYNGVPLPAPPSDVLALRKNYPEKELFLVLFFDAKRTWQWLPAEKLEILGIDKQMDQQKLVESRKPTERKAVKKAYQDALHYQSQVSDLEGQGPDPIM